MASVVVRRLVNQVNYSHISSLTSIQHSTSIKFRSKLFAVSFVSRRGYAKEKHSRDKVHLNIGTIGHVDHGKTTLTAAITKYLAEKNGEGKFYAYEQIDNAPEELARGITINASQVTYETEKRHFSHVDCPGHADYLKNMIIGTSQMDAAVLVVAATDGTMLQTREHLLLAKQIGLTNLAVYINKADAADSEMIELVEMEIREVLTSYGFDGDETPVVIGSALCSLEDKEPELGSDSIAKLVDVIDQLPLPERDLSSPAVLPVDSLYNIPGRGTVMSGCLSQGVITKGDVLEIHGFGKSYKVNVSSMEMFHKSLDRAEAGDTCGVLIKGAKREELRRGMVAVKAGTLKPARSMVAAVYLLSEKEGGRAKPFANESTCVVHFKTWRCVCRAVIGEEDPLVMPGEQGSINFLIRVPMILVKGDRFTIREGNRTLGTGIVTDIKEADKKDQTDVFDGWISQRRLKEKEEKKEKRKAGLL